MAHIHLSQALGKGLGSLFFFDHEPLARRSQSNESLAWHSQFFLPLSVLLLLNSRDWLRRANTACIYRSFQLAQLD